MQIKQIIRQLDTDGSGTVSYDEFVSYVSWTKRDLQAHTVS